MWVGEEVEGRSDGVRFDVGGRLLRRRSVRSCYYGKMRDGGGDSYVNGVCVIVWRKGRKGRGGRMMS